MDVADVQGWFGRYLDVFAACGRGDREDAGALLEFYCVPLVLASDQGVLALTSEDEVLRMVGQQVEGLCAASYHGSDVLAAQGSPQPGFSRRTRICSCAGAPTAARSPVRTRPT
jgi:hypothetical protein